MSVVAGLTLGACGDSPTAPLPSLDTCATGARLLLSRAGEPGPIDLVWRDGVFYYAASGGVDGLPHIWSVAGAGGSSTVLVDAFATRLWVRDDRILFASGPELSTVAPSGGTPTSITGPPGPGHLLASVAQEIDATSFYWTEGGAGPETLWTVPLEGGAPRQLAQTGLTASRIFPLTDDILMAELGGQIALVPKAGGPPRSLGGSNGAFMATDGQSIVWMRDPGPVDGNPGPALWLTDTDGQGGRSIWPGKPPTVLPPILSVRADGHGGWYVFVFERFAEGGSYDAIWHLDAAGAAMRLACNTQTATSALGPTVVSDALYMTVKDTTAAGPSWGLLRVGP